MSSVKAQRNPQGSRRRKPVKTRLRRLEDAEDAPPMAARESLTPASTVTAKGALNYPADVVAATGPLFPNPQQLGFTEKRLRTPRSTPKWHLAQPRNLVTPPIHRDEWDVANQNKMEQMEAQRRGDYHGLYEDFQRMRDVERKEMEKRGLVDAEGAAKDLTEAISFQGSCLDMCPTFERIRRANENNVKAWEKDKATGQISRDLAVKAFLRPAAGQPPPLPLDVRPPQVLQTTLDYLVNNAVNFLPDSHLFVWDRTRLIRQDFTYQNLYGLEAVDCNERIVRIHLVLLHIMAGSDVEYSQQQELEQFNKALQTLIEIYQDVRNHGGNSPNEPEFRAYQLLSHYRDPEPEREIQTLPPHIYNHQLVQLALRLRQLMSQNNVVERGVKNSPGALDAYVAFFRTVYSTEVPFLMASLLEVHFNAVRFYAFKAMARLYHSKAGGLTVLEVTNMLGFESDADTELFAEYYGVGVATNEQGAKLIQVSLTTLNLIQDKPKRAQAVLLAVTAKIGSQKLSLIVDLGLPNDSFHMTVAPKILEAPKIKPKLPKKPYTPIEQSVSSQPYVFGQKPNQATSVAPTTTSQPYVFGQRPNQNQNNMPAVFGAKPQPEVAPSITSNGSVKPSFGAPTTNTNIGFPKIPQKEPAPIDLKVADTEPSRRKYTPVVSGSEEPPLFLNSMHIKKPENVPVKTETSFNAPLIKPASVTEAPVAPAAPASPPKLRDHPQFSAALSGVSQNLVSSVVDKEVRALIESSLRAHQLQRKNREAIIDQLTGELYQAFIQEIIHNYTMQIIGAHFEDRWLAKRAVKQIAHQARESLAQKKLRERKRDELELVSLTGSIKFEPMAKRSAPDFNYYLNYRRDMDELWKAVDFESFSSVRPGLKMIVVAEDWDHVLLDWLGKKLGLTKNELTGVYENRLVNFTITSLPKSDFSMKETFGATPFLLLECVIDDENYQTKLAQAVRVLQKLVALLSRYLTYNAQIGIVLWDQRSHPSPPLDIERHLRLDELNHNPSIQRVEVAHMAHSDNVNVEFERFINLLGQHYDASLTARGERRRLRANAHLRNTSLVLTFADVLQLMSFIDAKEAEVIAQGSIRKRRFGYLEKYRGTKRRRTSEAGSVNLLVYNYLDSTMALINALVYDLANQLSLSKAVAERDEKLADLQLVLQSAKKYIKRT